MEQLRQVPSAVGDPNTTTIASAAISAPAAASRRQSIPASITSSNSVGGERTIYDSYPLSLRAYLETGPPPLARAVSQQHIRSSNNNISSIDEDILSTYNNTSSSTKSFLDGDQMRPSARASAMFSTFGKFQSEVYETKERSRVLSALKRRGKPSDARIGGRARGPVAPTKFTANDVIRAGTLTKQGSWRRNWKTRFFILRRDFPSLSYFTSEENLELLGEIAITEDTIVLDRSAGGHAPYRFQIRTHDKILLLEAESRDNQRRWMDACQELTDTIRSNKFRTSTTTTVSTATSTPAAENNQTKFTGHSSAPIQDHIRPNGAAHLTTTTTAATRPESNRENNQLLHQTVSQRSLKDNVELQRMLEVSSCSSYCESDADSGDDNNYEFFNSGQSLLASESIDETMVMGPGKRRRSRHQLTGSSRSSNPYGIQYDLSFEVMVGKKSKLLARNDNGNDKAGCLVKVSGYSRRLGGMVDIGMTEAIKLSTVLGAATAGGGGGGADDSVSARVPFSIIITCDLEKYDRLHLALYKCSLNQAPGTSQSCLGVGRCILDDDFLNSMARMVPLTEKSSSTRDSIQNSAPSPAKQVQGPPLGQESNALLGGSSSKLISAITANSGIQLIVQAFRSLSPQEVLPTMGIDMANSKYLIPTTLGSSGDAVSFQRPQQGYDFTRSSDMRTFVDNDSFLNDLGSGSLRFIAVDEILRVPRSTYALPLAYLDFLEEDALERTRRLHKQISAKGAHTDIALLEYELEYYRKKQEEYMKQRQFLMKQEQRLLDEQQDGKMFRAARYFKKVGGGKQKDKNAGEEMLAPFKRSTYKSLNLWQFLPTNMQDQFLCTYPDHPPSGGSSQPFVWHTMTMGCPAAHTKGFTNGGYPAIELNNNNNNNNNYNPARSSEEELLLYDHCTSPVSRQSVSPPAVDPYRRSRGSLTKPMITSDETLPSLKLKQELQDRLNIIGSQILSAAVACILASLDLAVLGSDHHRRQIENTVFFGYLLNFESLLSTQGKEIGMLEDFAAGVKWLRNVFIQFRKHKSSGSFFSIKKHVPTDRNSFDPMGSFIGNDSFDGRESASTGNATTGNYLLVTIGVSDAHLAVIPPSLMTGKAFRIHCVLFTQGVNEKQSLVHAYKANSVKLQERINRENLEELKQIYTIYRAMYEAQQFNNKNRNCETLTNRGRSSSVGGETRLITKHSIEALDDLLVQIQHHICSPSNNFKKNVGLLMDSSDFCRQLGGARVTCCKSGKDRTAMSVTLEQVRICCSELKATQGTTICSNMRLYGVRRKNVFMNTKADKFAFNEMQRKMLPDCYKPPVGTYKSGKT